MDVLKRSAALSIPKHEAIGGIIGHPLVFRGIEFKPTRSPRWVDEANLPVADVVAKGSGYRVDDYSLVAPICQLRLQGAIDDVVEQAKKLASA